MAHVAAVGTSADFSTPLGGRFYTRLAWGFLAVGLLGFTPTYWLPLARGTLTVSPLTHLHALLFYGWLVLFCWQATLVSTGRTPRHRELGVAGVSLATAMIFVGVATGLQTVRQQQAAGFDDAAARAFGIVPISAVLLFGGLVAAALLNVRRPETHRRLMLVATASILQAAVARWFLLLMAPPRPPDAVGPPPPPPIAVTVPASIVIDVFLVAMMLYDRRTRGRIHPAYWVAGAAVVAVQYLRIPAATTAAWQGAVAGLLALLP